MLFSILPQCAFGGLLALVVLMKIFTDKIYLKLQNSHQEKWKQLGFPSQSDHLTWNQKKALINFLKNEDYLSLNDSHLIRTCRQARAIYIGFIIYFVLSFVGMLIGSFR